MRAVINEVKEDWDQHLNYTGCTFQCLDTALRQRFEIKRTKESIWYEQLECLVLQRTEQPENTEKAQTQINK